MAEEEEEETEPAVELGEGDPVEGAPVARVASRLTWPIERSEIERKEGDVEIRTPEGPWTVSTVLADTDVTYFERREEFIEAIREAVGVGPVTTE
jgi:hypothetical protein